MKNLKKIRIRRLEKSLIGSLVDPKDSAERRRYVKRWIYGEVLSNKSRSINSQHREKRKLSLWEFFHRIITGDDL